MKNSLTRRSVNRSETDLFGESKFFSVSPPYRFSPIKNTITLSYKHPSGHGYRLLMLN